MKSGTVEFDLGIYWKLLYTPLVCILMYLVEPLRAMLNFFVEQSTEAINERNKETGNLTEANVYCRIKVVLHNYCQSSCVCPIHCDIGLSGWTIGARL